MSTNDHFGPGEISDWFWDIIQQADKSPSKLRAILQDLSNSEVYRFALEFMLASGRLRGEPFTAHIGYGSEDFVEDMSYWAVSQGKEFYTKVWHHPETVGIYKGDTAQNRTSLEGVAESTFNDRRTDEIDNLWQSLNADLGKYVHSGYTRISDYWDARRVHEQGS